MEGLHEISCCNVTAKRHIPVLLYDEVSFLFQLRDGNMKADLEASLPAGQEDSAIRCRDVCRSYGKLKVLSNLNLTVPQGHM